MKLNEAVFRESLPDMEEREILSYLLRPTIPAARIDAVSDALLDKFGSLKAVFEARPEQLETVPGIGKKTAVLISSFVPIVRVWNRINSTTPAALTNRMKAESYCKSLLAGARAEEFWVICLNARCQVVGKRRISTGTLSECAAYPRSVMETALNYNAHSVFFTHNHPGGTCSPSREDITSTIQLKRLLNGVGILLLDHVIVAGDSTYSMCANGDIDIR